VWRREKLHLKSMIEETAYPVAPLAHATQPCHLDPERSRRARFLRRSGEIAVLAFAFALVFFIPEGNLLLAHPPQQPVILSEDSRFCES